MYDDVKDFNPNNKNMCYINMCYKNKVVSVRLSVV